MAKSSGITIIPDGPSFDRAQEVLNPQQLRRALFQGVKRTTDKGGRITGSVIEDATTLARKYIRRAIKTKLEIHDPDPPIGIITISHRPVPAIAYKPKGPGMKIGARNKAPGGISFKPYKDRPARVFKRGFAATVKNPKAGAEDVGHLGVFIRKRISGSRANQKGFAKRLPIRELMGPSVVSVIELPKVGAEVYRQLAGAMDKQIASQIDRFTKGKS